MLILSRKTEQKILIGNDILVSVLEIKKDCVKIGIDAPKNIRVYRHEVYEAIQSENRMAVRSNVSAIDITSEDMRPL